MRPKKWLQTRLCGEQMLPSSVGEALKDLPYGEEDTFLQGPPSLHMRGTLSQIWGEGRCFWFP